MINVLSVDKINSITPYHVQLLKFRKLININLLVYKYTYYAAYGQQDYFR